MPQATPSPRLTRSNPLFKRAVGALFASGFATFALLYSVQPLLPEFSREFGIDAATSSLAVSLATAFLACSMLVASPLSNTLGRKPVMFAALLLAAVATLLVAVQPTWSGVLLARIMVGIALAGLPAVAMAYLAEEMSDDALGLAMGLYIGGNGIGGMAGRFMTGLLTDVLGWRMALLVLGGGALLLALAFLWLLPASRNFTPRKWVGWKVLGNFGPSLKDRGLRLLYTESFLLMGCFVSVYNYLGYRLLKAPYSLTQTQIAMVFTLYLIGTVSAAVMGNLTARFGRRQLLPLALLLVIAGIVLTLLQPLWLIITGVALLTAGFFGAHSMASSWVGLRAAHSRAEASALYLFSYYIGGSLIGTLSGVVYHRYDWPGLVMGLTVIAALAMVVAHKLAALPRLPKAEAMTEAVVAN